MVVGKELFDFLVDIGVIYFVLNIKLVKKILRLILVIGVFGES